MNPRAVVVGVLLAAASRAPAQDLPAADPGETFELNTVLVASFDAVQSFLEPEAERVRGLVEAALAQSYVVLTMTDVPAFADYTADVYLRSCPEGQYMGCVFVVGGRAKTDWVIGGQVSAVEGGYRVDLSFIDVSQAKLSTEVDVTLDGSNDQTFKEGVLTIIDALVSGEIRDLDVRGDPEAEAAAREEAEAADKEAKRFSVDSVYEDPDDVGRGDVSEDSRVRGVDGSGGKVSTADLQAMEDKGGLSPWDKAGLTRSQYKLYRNSGARLAEFRDRLLGRKGQIMLGASAQLGTGPWGQQHDTWYLQAADSDNYILDQSAVQRQTRVPMSIGGQLHVDIGLASWVELGAFAGIRQAPYSYRFFRQIPETEADLTDPTTQGVVSWYAGVRIGFIPFPAFPVRPRLHIGASYWSGNSLQKLVAVPTYLVASQMLPNNMVLVHVEPGAEVSAGKWILLWTRFDLNIPVLGRNVQQFDVRCDPTRPACTGEKLDGRPDTTTDKGFALGASLGLTIRVPVGKKRRGL